MNADKVGTRSESVVRLDSDIPLGVLLADPEPRALLSTAFELHLHADYARMVEAEGPVSWPCPCTSCDTDRNAQGHPRSWVKRTSGMLTDYFRRW